MFLRRKCNDMKICSWISSLSFEDICNLTHPTFLIFQVLVLFKRNKKIVLRQQMDSGCFLEWCSFLISFFGFSSVKLRFILIFLHRLNLVAPIISGGLRNYNINDEYERDIRTSVEKKRLCSIRWIERSNDDNTLNDYDNDFRRSKWHFLFLTYRDISDTVNTSQIKRYIESWVINQRMSRAIGTDFQHPNNRLRESSCRYSEDCSSNNNSRFPQQNCYFMAATDKGALEVLSHWLTWMIEWMPS